MSPAEAIARGRQLSGGGTADYRGAGSSGSAGDSERRVIPRSPNPNYAALQGCRWEFWELGVWSSLGVANCILGIDAVTSP